MCDDRAWSCATAACCAGQLLTCYADFPSVQALVEGSYGGGTDLDAGGPLAFTSARANLSRSSLDSGGTRKPRCVSPFRSCLAPTHGAMSTCTDSMQATFGT